MTAHEVLVAIRRIVRRIAEHSQYLSREVGLTVPQLLCLKAIGEMGEGGAEVTVAKVGGHVHLSVPTVSRIVDRLARAGLIERKRGVDDRRRVGLSLTAAGRIRFQTLPTPLQEQFVNRLAALDPRDQQALLNALARITELMDATHIDAAPMLTPGAELDADAAPR